MRTGYTLSFAIKSQLAAQNVLGLEVGCINHFGSLETRNIGGKMRLQVCVSGKYFLLDNIYIWIFVVRLRLMVDTYR